jgi:hypothetical protein
MFPMVASEGKAIITFFKACAVALLNTVKAAIEFNGHTARRLIDTEIRAAIRIDAIWYALHSVVLAHLSPHEFGNGIS